MNDIEQIIIIGSGPAGLTAAIYAGRANRKPLVIEGKNPGGQLMGTSYVENWPGEKSILGPTLMMNMREHAQAMGARFIADEIVKLDAAHYPFTLSTATQQLKTYSIILAMGTIPRRLGCPGENEYWGKGVTTCAVCDGAFYAGKSVMVVGGGDSAMEEASFLTKFTDKITIVHILDQLTASYAMQKRVIDNKNINIIYNSTLTCVEGNGEHITHACIENQKTKEKSKIPMDGIFVAIGLTPKTEFLKGQVDLNNYGYVLVHPDKAKTATSIDGIFVAGDVADPYYRQAVAAAGSGCMAALDAESYLKANGV